MKYNRIIELGTLNPTYRHGLLIFGANGIAPTLTTMMGTGGGNVPLIITVVDRMEKNISSKDSSRLVYHQQPTKQDLIDYFGQRIRIRKLTERECFRLMDLDDADIDKIDAYPFASAQERETYLEQADKQQIKEVKQDTIPKTAKLKMAGNSIVVACLYHIFKSLFIEPTKSQQPQQLSLF